jgi:hypothetical protein
MDKINLDPKIIINGDSYPIWNDITDIVDETYHETLKVTSPFKSN